MKDSVTVFYIIYTKDSRKYTEKNGCEKKTLIISEKI